MPIEDAIRTRLVELAKDGRRLAGLGNQHEQCVDTEDRADCAAWLAAAHNAVHLVIEKPASPYRQKADVIASGTHGYQVHLAVGELARILEVLLKDGDAGLLASVADQARAETFDDFLDHALHYLHLKRKQEAGVIAGVVFEDTLRRVCRKHGIPDKDVKLDSLISELAGLDLLTTVKAKRARAAADVRTKATHAQWDEFEIEDVRATINFARELMDQHLA